MSIAETKDTRNIRLTLLNHTVTSVNVFERLRKSYDSEWVYTLEESNLQASTFLIKCMQCIVEWQKRQWTQNNSITLTKKFILKDYD